MSAPRDVPRALGAALAALGSLGLLAASILTVEKIHLLQAKLDYATGVTKTNPTLTCDFSRWASCSGVMSSHQAEAFGFANSVIGIIGFAVVVALGVVWWTGAELPAWTWAGLQAGATFAIGFVTWLQVQSIFVIGLLCVYCVVVWLVTIPLFVLVTRQSLRTWAPGASLTRVVDHWTLLIVLLWYVAVGSAAVLRFGSTVLS